jgi:hypothetical protein
MPDIPKPTSLNTIWADGGDKIKPSDDKIQEGWLPEIPTRQNFNWLDNRQDQFNAHVNQHGLPVWDDQTEYQANKSYTAGSNGTIYISKALSRGIDPVEDTAEVYWEQAFVTVNGYAGGKRYSGYEVFSSDFTALVNRSYYLNLPLTVTFPLTANVGDAIVIAKNPNITATAVINGVNVTLQTVNKNTYVYTSNGWVDVSSGNGSGEDVSLSGLTIVTQGTTATYTITDYNSFSIYSVSSSVGTATRTNESISLVIPNPTTVPQITLTVIKDGTPSYFVIAVGAQSVVIPTILYPTSGQANVELSPTLSATAFTTAPAGQDTHQSSQWQVATDSGFTTIVFDSGVDTVNKTNIQVPSGVLTIGTVYYARVRYTGVVIGNSAWSVTLSFTTTNQYVVTPTVSVTGGPTDVGETPVISTPPFAVFGGTDTHVSTDWQIVKVSDGSLVWQSLGNTTNKVSITVPPSLLLENTQYKARVRQAGASLGKSGWGEYTFTTKVIFFVFTPASAGLPYGGGYYAGANITVGAVQYALIVAPKSQGGQSEGLPFRSTSPTSLITTQNDGLSNQNTILTAYPSTSPAAQFCDTLSINGYTDWYLPANNELEICYRYLKPTTTPNLSVYGVNPDSVPAGNRYTSDNPAVTSVAAFRLGQAEAFEPLNYWTSTMDGSKGQASAFAWTFDNGNDSSYIVSTSNGSFVARAVRRVAIPT